MTTTKASCGCCVHGCVCWNHRDEPNGVFAHKCGIHTDTMGTCGFCGADNNHQSIRCRVCGRTAAEAKADSNLALAAGR